MSILCTVRIHKYEPIRATIKWETKYTQTAELICRRCKKKAFGRRDSIY